MIRIRNALMFQLLTILDVGASARAVTIQVLPKTRFQIITTQRKSQHTKAKKRAVAKTKKTKQTNPASSTRTSGNSEGTLLMITVLLSRSANVDATPLARCHPILPLTLPLQHHLHITPNPTLTILPLPDRTILHCLQKVPNRRAVQRAKKR